MNNTLRSVEELKSLTLQKKISFSKLANYFFDLTEQENFIELGEPYESENDNQFFKTLLKPVTNFFSEKISVELICLVRMENFKFVHGSTMLSNRILVPLYFFEEPSVGLAIASCNGSTEFFRISAKLVSIH